jgi:hypothetical protein
VKASEKYDTMVVGVVAGLLIPIIMMILFYLWKSGGMSVADFLQRLISAGALTNALSVSVFVNAFVFMLFNWCDMLKASKGILGITILWAIAVFIIKFT